MVLYHFLKELILSCYSRFFTKCHISQNSNCSARSCKWYNRNSTTCHWTKAEWPRTIYCHILESAYFTSYPASELISNNRFTTYLDYLLAWDSIYIESKQTHNLPFQNGDICKLDLELLHMHSTHLVLLATKPYC